MNKSTSTAVTGVAVALAAGTAAAMIANQSRRKSIFNTRKMKRGTARAIRNVNSMLNSVEHMMR